MKSFVLLAALGLMGCSNGPNTICYQGVTYIKSSASMRAGITIALDRAGRPVPCEEK